MKTITLSFLAVVLAASAHAQRIDGPAPDSVSKSNLYISLGYGTSQAALTAQQLQFKTVPSLSPAITYVNKTGFGAGYTAFLYAGQVTGSKLYEQDLTFSYSFDKSDLFSFGMGYTAYLFNQNSSVPATPLKNDLYGYFSYDDAYLDPGITLDYGFGSITTKARVLNGKRRSITVAAQKISGNDFSALFDISHDYDLYTLFTTGDDLSFTPQISLITATENYYQGKNALQSVAARRLKNLQGAVADGSKFKPRYVETSFTADYSIGKFDLIPDYTLTLPITGPGRHLGGYFSGSLILSF